MEENNVNNDLNRRPLNDDFFKKGQRLELAPRSKMVFVTGILFTVFGVLALGNAALSFKNAESGIQYLSATLTAEGVEQMIKVMPIIRIYSLIMGIAELAAGISGVLYCRKPEKAFFIIAYGVLLIGMVMVNSIVVGRMTTRITTTYMKPELIGNMKEMVSGITKMSTIIGMLLALIVPVLYLIGGFILNKRRVQEERLGL